MITTHPTPPKAPPNRDVIRRDLHEHVDAIFNRLFPEDPSKPLPAFDQIEDQTRQLTRDLESWLLEQRVQSAADARSVEAPACPHCQRPARRVGKPDDPLSRRVLTTRAGPIELAREKWRCTACRVVFFPPRPTVAIDAGGL
jgi:hypothetical protein